MRTVMYFDVRRNEYVGEKEPCAAPEFYIPVFRGPKGIYIDTWNVTREDKPGKKFLLGIAYLAEEYYDSLHHDAKEKFMFEKNKFTPTSLAYFTLPEDKFDEYVERFGVEDD